MQQITDDDLGIKTLIIKCQQLAESKGFINPTFNEMIALLHSEVSEAYEEYRGNHPEWEIYYNEDNPKPEGVPVEFADLAIRLFHYCGVIGIDLCEAIRIKLEYNATRPHRHGNKKT